MMARFADWLLRHRVTGWGILAGLTIASVVGMMRLEYDDDLRSSFRSEEDFGSLETDDDAFVCIVRGEGLFDHDVVARLIEFDQELRKVPGIGKVASLFGGTSWGGGGLSDAAAISPRIAGPASTPAENLATREVSEVEALFLSKSGRTMLFAAEPKPEFRLVEDLIPIEKEIEKLLADLTRRTGLDAEITGMPALRIVTVQMARREQLFNSIGTCLLGGIFALIMFRRAAALAVIFPVPFVAIAWVSGAMGLAGEPFNTLNIMISAIIPIVALGDAIHLTYAIRRHLVAGKDPRRAASAGLAEVGPACFMTSFTTAVSFASLALSSNPVVARFGAFCACGTMFAYVAVILLTPLAASAFPGRHLVPRGSRSGTSPRFAGMAALVSRRPGTIVAAAGIAIALGTAACLRLGFDYRYSENLDPASTEMRAIERIDREFGGSQPLSIVALWPEASAVGDSRILKVLEAIHAAVEDPARTGRPFSIWSLWKEAGGSRSGATLEDLEEIFPDLSIETLFDRERGAALIKVSLRDEGAKSLAPFLDGIERRFGSIERDHPGLRIRFAGLTAASIRNSEPMIRELTASLFAAGLVIFITIGISVRSWTLGLVSIVPNVLPMVMAGAWLQLSGHEVRYVSALCFSVCLGVAVDDTIHFLFRYRENRRRGLEPGPAVRETVVTVGTSLVTTTCILLGGFALLLTSEVPTIRLFGAMGVLTLAVALVGDLVVLPALLLLRKRPQVAGDSGEEPGPGSLPERD